MNLPRIQTARLSVILPTLAWPPLGMLGEMGARLAQGALSNRAKVERAIESVLTQPDPVGTELIVVDEGLPDGTTEYLTEAFSLALSTGKMKIVSMPKDRGDRGAARNFGAEASNGVFLTFLDPEDRWLPGRLDRLSPALARHDLILSASESPTDGWSTGGIETDWLRAFFSHNWALPSSTVVHRSLFSEVGGFRVGYQRFPLPTRIPGQLDYEFWLNALLKLSQSGRRDRFTLLSGGTRDLEVDPAKSAHPGFARKLGQWREIVTLVSLARQLPWKSWPEIFGHAKKRIR